MVSGNCSASELDYCINSNGKIKAFGFLKKPVNLNDFKEIISSIS